MNLQVRPSLVEIIVRRRMAIVWIQDMHLDLVGLRSASLAAALTANTVLCGTPDLSSAIHFTFDLSYVFPRNKNHKDLLKQFLTSTMRDFHLCVLDL